MLYVANVGDCQAVLGFETDRKEITPKVLTKTHDCKNQDEVKLGIFVYPNNYYIITYDREYQ